MYCSAKQAQEIWIKPITEVKAWMENTNTEPAIQHALLVGVHAWRQRAPHPKTAPEAIVGVPKELVAPDNSGKIECGSKGSHPGKYVKPLD